MARPRADSRNSKDNAKGLKQEILGIALLALALYAAISLFSYNSPSNWGGVVGVYLSKALLKTIGYTSYVFPFILVVISIGFLLRRLYNFRASVPISFAFFIISFSAFLSQLLLKDEAGGYIGAHLSRILTNYIGGTGTLIILFAIVLITVLIATGISLVQMGVKIAPPATSVFIFLLSKKEKDIEEDDEEPEDIEEEEVKKPAPKPAVKERVTAPAIITPKTQSKKASEDSEKEELEFSSPKGTFRLPPLSLLDPTPEKANSIDSKYLLENSQVLEKKLLDFGIEGRVLEVRPGPVVTMYEFEPAPGVKVGRITNLSDDLALAMKAMSIRIIAPIPGKSVVGIEVPNQSREMIRLKEMLEGTAYQKSRSRLSLALGKDISGNPYIADLARMPHLLVAGATGTGKSVSVNAMILSILFKATPEDVRFLMVDPKMLELSAYEGIPHLITPVITDPKKAAGALKSIVTEMGRRYKLMAEKGSKNIEKYNQQIEDDGGEDAEQKRLPYIVVMIDELADLMMTSGKDVEECLVRLSQMARASGIHLMIATQRPSVDVVTGLIKTNFPARIAFQLPSRTDSRTILDAGGAETLLGEGDMLFLPPGTSKLQRIHGVYVSETEIKKVTDFWKKQGSPQYDTAIIEEASASGNGEEDLDTEFLKRYDEAVEMASQLEMISTSYIQRRFRIGYNTAARIIEKMEKQGVVGPAQGSRPREVLLRKQ
ncbi:MAG: DNA translocase FtsK 4TM domain-containing protein [Deltaproteobacteria bacterium]|nr:DNA translocase FtsK 4TM domain-containing protein [Deltaproteobacteria bacterium]